MRLNVVDQGVVVVALGFIAQSALRRAARWSREVTSAGAAHPRAAVVAALALLALALAARLATPPALLHSSFQAERLVEDVLSFPTVSAHRATYGQGSFVVLGALVAALGRSVESVFRANAMLQTGALGIAAALVARAGGPWAGLGTLAAGALAPLMLRVAASEDAHNVAVCAGLLGMLWADAWRRRPGGLSDALGIVGAAVLCADSRQGMVLWAIAIALLTGEGRAARPAIALGALMLVPTLIMRVSDAGDQNSYAIYALGPLVCQGPAFWANHPLLREPAAWPLTALAVVGAAAAWRRRERQVLILAGTALAHLAMSWAVVCVHMPREAAYQRLGLFALASLLAGYGVSALASLPRRGGGGVAAVATAALLLSAAPAFARLRRSVEPFHAELMAIRRHLAGRGPVTLVVPHFRGQDAPAFAPRLALRDLGVQVVTADAPEARRPGALRFQSIACFAVPLGECASSAGDEDIPFSYQSFVAFRRELVRGISEPTHLGRMMGCALPRGPRAECLGDFARGRFEPWVTLDLPQDQMPAFYFSEARVTLGVWRDDPPAAP